MPGGQGQEPSEFALAFGERRLRDVFASLRKLSPALAESVEKEAGSGALFERMARASGALSRAAAGMASGSADKRVSKELSASMGKSHSAQNARALLMAHSQGLLHLASPEGLGGAIFLHFAGGFRAALERNAAREKADPALTAAALELVDTWVRSLLMQSSPEDPDDPIRAIAFADAESAEKWSGRLYLRCTQLSSDERVADLVMRSFRSSA